MKEVKGDEERMRAVVQWCVLVSGWVGLVRVSSGSGLEWAGVVLAKYQIFSTHRFASRGLESGPPGEVFGLLGEERAEAVWPDRVGAADAFWDNVGLNSFQLQNDSNDIWANGMGFREAAVPAGVRLSAAAAEANLKRANLEAFLSFANARAFTATRMHRQCWDKTWPASNYLPDFNVISIIHPWNEPWSLPCYSCLPPGSQDGSVKTFWAFKPAHRVDGPLVPPSQWMSGVTARVPEGSRLWRVSRASLRWALEAPERMPGSWWVGEKWAEMGGREVKQQSGQGRAFFFAQRLRHQPVSGVTTGQLHYQEPDGRFAHLRLLPVLNTESPCMSLGIRSCPQRRGRTILKWPNNENATLSEDRAAYRNNFDVSRLEVQKVSAM